MKQATLQLKYKIQNVDIMNNNIEVRRVIFNVMLSILVALTLWYVVILANMVLNIIQRKTLEKEMLSLSGEVSNLELSYLSVSSSVDMNLSSTMGFKETKINFATRKSLGSLKLANNEI
jgi:hypothetical protein